MILNVHWAIELSLGKSKWLLFGCYRPPSWPQYLRLALVFVWSSALQESLISVFEEFFDNIGRIFILEGGGGAGHGALILWGLDTFLIFLICLISKLLSFKLLGNSYILCLKIYYVWKGIIAHRFTCGERNIRWNIKKSQNIMKMIADHYFSTILRMIWINWAKNIANSW